MGIREVKGDLLTSECVVRCHQVNCRGVMGAGIAAQIKEKYPEVFPLYEGLCSQFGDKMLGEVQFIPCHDGTVIANMFAQDGYGAGKCQTDIYALEECLDRLQIFAAKTGASIGFPKYVGAGLAGGDWNQIYSLIHTYFDTKLIDCLIVEYDRKESGEKPMEAPADESGAGQGTVTAGEEKPESAPAAEDKTSERPKAGKKRGKFEVSIYTDGSCLGNPGAGGWGAILMAKGVETKELSGGEKKTTNQRMELTAAIKALEALRSPCKVELYSDSSYLVNSVTRGWMAGWKKAGWTKKGGLANVDLWQQLDALLERHDVSLNWVKGHATNPYNNRCDTLARAAAGEVQ